MAFADHMEEATAPMEGHSFPHPISTHVIAKPQPLRAALLQWYAGVHEDRGMPWRKPYNASFGPAERAQRAYEVWISEIMLQQTQVATVIPYYNKWIAKFPTIRDLAAADIDTVNSLWKGLGYYSRAARLLAGAKKAVEEFGGRLPDNAESMEAKIPGIGRYSAGAICSIAYNQCVPVVSLYPSLTRVLALHAQPKAKQTSNVLWAAATAMVEGSDKPGDLNQAMIEVGSTVCKVRDPSCSSCPIRPHCRGYQLSTTEKASETAEVPDIEELCTLCESLPHLKGSSSLVTAFPMKAERKKAREELDLVNVVEWRHGDQRWFLLVRRPEGGLLAGLTEFPTSPNASKNISPSESQTVSHTLLSQLLKPRLAPLSNTRRKDPEGGTDLRIIQIKSAGDVVHVFSHIKKTYRVQWIILEGGGDSPPELNLNAPNIVGAQKKAGARTGKPKSSKKSEASTGELPMATWTLLEQVAEANITTGVQKVWRLARTLWDSKSDSE
ncbi:hypothetical protein JAAARDRAFT_56149 [Jaapia argillacea MUCL 33604]|uniref:Adenine DNA glycosylase n=1 Tax=Jaapia argillacea MUCL 33604 TaxID=933084 RepID=A0A067QC65_9AGAM|nr:hypothetical protein JAAARDRAFT_56149 [Jaapia argillacea MUCL 33604]